MTTPPHLRGARPAAPGAAVTPGTIDDAGTGVAETAVLQDTAEPGSTATYVFAVCRGDAPAGVRAWGPGHRTGGEIRALLVDGLVAVVQDVPADEFSEALLTERLADRDALEMYARAHHRVVSAAAQHAAAAPLPLATIYRGDDRARAAVREGAARFHAALDRIGNRVEWGVKVHSAPREQPTAPAPATAPGAPAVSTSTDRGARRAGRAYLERVRGRNQAREQQQDSALHAAERTHLALRERTVAARRLRPHSAELSGERGPQVLNAAYLVDRRSERLVPAAVEELRAQPWAQDVRIELTGPWVPYSFADVGGARDEG